MSEARWDSSLDPGNDRFVVPRRTEVLYEKNKMKKERKRIEKKRKVRVSRLRRDALSAHVKRTTKY
jgi:hypothetical protein